MRVLVFIAWLMSVSTATAQQLGAYYAEIGNEDRFNSSGAPLRNLGAILQQDRANFHRFGIRHGGDDSDPFFGNPQIRAAIPKLYARGRRDELIEKIILEGNPLGIVVFVCGIGGAISHLSVDFADGDGYRGC